MWLRELGPEFGRHLLEIRDVLADGSFLRYECIALGSDGSEHLLSPYQFRALGIVPRSHRGGEISELRDGGSKAGVK